MPSPDQQDLPDDGLQPGNGGLPEDRWLPDDGRRADDRGLPEDRWLPDDGRDVGDARRALDPAGVVATVRDGVADRLPAGLRNTGRAVPPRAALTAAAVALALVLGLVAHRFAAGPASLTVAEPVAATSGSGRASSTRTSTGSATGQAAGSSAVGSVPAGGPGSGTGPIGGTGSGGVVVVDVEGRVRTPGLVRLTPGARVADAVRAAGGPSAGAALIRINLARPLSDGEQVVVPGPNDPLPAGANGSVPGGSGTSGAGSGGRSAAGSGGAVDLNTATESQLDTLPGVGPVLAGRIVTWRTEHGRFTDVGQLGEVSGIGDALLAKLRPLVRV
jgi:competence protein ComEA